jgi:trans-aconitate 2-methyltransferase
MTTWDPEQYRKFADHRLRPALDLMARIPLAKAETVWDLGCGTGNVTKLLAERFAGARVVGVDNSPEMLSKAGAIPDIAWLAGDVATWSAPHPADLVFSNAVLHWIPDHERLVPRLLSQVRPGGVLAIQVPRNFAAASHIELYATACSLRWRDRLARLTSLFDVATPVEYWRWLDPLSSALDIWESAYLHVLTGANAVVEWTKGTAVKPFLDALPAVEQADFLADYGARISRAYPRERDGRTLFQFRRLFIVATRKTT